MGEAIGGMLASAVGVAISPLPLIAMILTLAAPKGRGNGLAFTAGWVAGLAAVVTVVVLFGSDGNGDGGEPLTWVAWLKLALGLLFLLMAVKQRNGRPRAGREAGQPSWMRTIDRFTPGKAAGLAVVLVVAHPKNLVLAVGGAVSIATADAGGAAKTVAVLA